MNHSLNQKPCCEADCGSPHAHTHTPAEIAKINNRISRIVGHLESVKRMVSDGRDCTEILVQLCAIRAAVNSVSRSILNEHLKSCVQDAIKDDDTEALDDFVKVLNMLMK